MGQARVTIGRFAPVASASLGSIVLGVADGGFHARTWGPSAVAFAAAVDVALLVSSRLELSRLELAVLGLFGAFAGWSALSATWSADPSASLREAERALLYLVALLAMLITTRRGFSIALLYGVLLAATFVSFYGVVEYLVVRPVDPFEGTLLFEPLGYANAAGVLAAIGVVISCGLAASARTLAMAVVRALPLAILVPTLVLSESRGAWAALAIALGAFTALRLRLTRVEASVLMAVLVIGGGFLIWELGSRSYGDRPSYWRVAWDDYQDNPVLGSGAGTYFLAWGETVAPSGGTALDAHNLYLESLAELGPVGLGLIAAALCMPLYALRRGGLTSVAGAGYLALLAHAGVDWDWEMPAVMLSGLGCAAALLVAQRQPGALVRFSVRWRAATAVTATATAVAVLADQTLV